jgi:hypothetical protein
MKSNEPTNMRESLLAGNKRHLTGLDLYDAPTHFQNFSRS